MMDFSGHAGQASDFDLLPKGLLVWAILNVQGLKTSATPSRYLEVELTVDAGQPFAGRKLWDKIGDPMFQGNSEKYRQMGQIAVTRILEAGRNAGPHNPAGYQIAEYSQLSGLRVAIKVGIEEGTDGHDDKNRVAEWLTPNPQSQSGYKGFERLSKGDHGLQQQAQSQAPSGFGGAPAKQQQGGFGGGGGQPQPQTSGFGNGSGFQAPPADSSGQSGANGAGSATAQSATGFAEQSGATMGPRSDPAATPGWLNQAQGGAPA